MYTFRAALRRLFVSVFALSLLLLGACHERNGMPHSMADVIINFPPPVSSTDADSIVVRGTANGRRIRSLYVNGILAESSDGYETWSAELPLRPGENLLNVVTIEGKWNLEHSAGSVVITREDVADVGAGPAFSFPAVLALDSVNNRVLVTDLDLAAVLAVDLATGDRSVISDADTGTGPVFALPAVIVLDEANEQALVLDAERPALMRVDLVTGNRRIISDADTGDGPLFTEGGVGPQTFALDSPNNRALVFDAALSAMLAVDLITGDRTVMSDSATGDGPDFTYIVSMVPDPENNRILAGDFGNGLMAVDLSSGDRSVIVDPYTGNGPFNLPASIALDSANNRVLMADYDFVESMLLDVNLDSGDRGVIADNYTNGSGPCLCFLISIVLDAENNRVLGSEVGHAAMFAIDLVNGQRVIWSQ